MKKLALLTPLLVVTSCRYVEVETRKPYGVFLGADSSSVNELVNYQNVCIDIDEFSSEDISYLTKKETNVYAYLSVGTIESYRSYYEEYKDFAFMDYENWPDEKWVDISQDEWKFHLYNEAERFKELGALGLFLDNFDVYYIASEVYEGDDISADKIFAACKDIISYFHQLDMKLIINGGSTLLEKLFELSQDQFLQCIDVYCQETVFSKIVDYDNEVFEKQDEDETNYYLSVISFMKRYSTILLLEYTVDEQLKSDIVDYCSQNNYYYYISSHVNLT